LDQDVAPSQSPAQVVGLPLTPGTVLTFTVAGSVSFLAGAPPTDPPDGADELQPSPLELRDGVLGPAASANGIAGFVAPINALVGVFLDDAPPTSSPAPNLLDFSAAGIGTAFQSLCPALKQVFYIGDGLSGRGSGSPQRFVVPPGATRLFLGTVDGHGWLTNTGAFAVTVTPGPAAPAFAELTVNAAAFAAGETLVLNVHACNPAGNPPVDLYLGALFPDGDTLAFLSQPNVVGGLARVSEPAPVTPIQGLGSGVAATGRVLEYTFPASGLATGTYSLFGAVLRQDSLDDDTLNDGDLVGLTLLPIVYAP
jgi:hypothetical protein